MICSNCKNLILKEVSTCPKCGESITFEGEIENYASVENKNEQFKKTVEHSKEAAEKTIEQSKFFAAKSLVYMKEFLSKNNKKTLLYVSIVSIVIFTFILYGNYQAISKNELKEKLVESIKKQDSKLFLSLFSEEIRSSEFAEEGAQTILEEWGSTKANFNVNRLITNYENSVDSTDDLFNISIEKKKFLFVFDTYGLTTLTSKITISKELKDSILKINKKKIASNKKIFPGVFEVSASQEFEYTTLKGTQVYYVSGDGTNFNVDIHLEGRTVTLPKGPDNVLVLLKNKETDFSLNTEKTQEFGPIGEEDYEKLSYKVDVPLLKSKTLPFKENTSSTQDVKFLQKEVDFDFEALNTLFINLLKEEIIATSNRTSSNMKFVTARFKNDNESLFNNQRHTHQLITSYFYKNNCILLITSSGDLKISFKGFATYKQLTPTVGEFSNTIDGTFVYDAITKEWLVDDCDWNSSWFSSPNKDNSIITNF